VVEKVDTKLVHSCAHAPSVESTTIRSSMNIYTLFVSDCRSFWLF
jgi:hypothetical protein